MNTTTKMIVSITLAAAAGAAIGMLIAPEKGKVLQKKIREGTSDLIKDFSFLLGNSNEEASGYRSKMNPLLQEVDVENELGV